MKTQKTLVCLFMTGLALLSGCGAQADSEPSQSTVQTVSGSAVGGKSGTAAAAQQKNPESSDYELSHVKYYDADGTCTMEVSFDYNEAGKEIHRIQQNYGEQPWTFESNTTYPDASTQVETCIDPATGVRDQVNTTVYNAAGDIQTKTTTTYDQNRNEGDLMDRTDYTYDSQGNLILKVVQSTAVVGAEFSHTRRTAYAYDAAGNCISEKETYSHEGQEDKVDSDLEYQYDGSGNKIREINHIAEEYVYSPIIYEYNGQNQLIKKSDYASTAPETLKQYYVYEYNENGKKKKSTCYSADGQLLNYAEFEYVKISATQANAQTASGKDGLYKTWHVDGTASATIAFQFIDPSSDAKCEIEGYDVARQQADEGRRTSTSATITDNTIEMNSSADEYVTFTYSFDTDGSLLLKDTSTGSTIRLLPQ